MTRYIAIDGRGGSGKTYLSNMLAEELGCKVLHLDEFGDDFKPFIGIPRLKEELQQVSAEYVIYEGIGVFRDEFDMFNAFRIFVDTPEDIRQARVASRDVPRSDRLQADWDKIFKIWGEVEEIYFTDETRNKANLVVGKDGEFNVEEIISRFREHFSLGQHW